MAGAIIAPASRPTSRANDDRQYTPAHPHHSRRRPWLDQRSACAETAAFVRDEALRLTDLADQHVMSASPDLPGILAVDKDGTPLEMLDRKTGDAILRTATDEPEVMPAR